MDTEFYIVSVVKFNTGEDAEEDNLIEKFLRRAETLCEMVNLSRLHGITLSYSPEIDTGESYQVGTGRKTTFWGVYMIEEDKAYITRSRILQGIEGLWDW